MATPRRPSFRASFSAARTTSPASSSRVWSARLAMVLPPARLAYFGRCSKYLLRPARTCEILNVVQNHLSPGALHDRAPWQSRRAPAGPGRKASAGACRDSPGTHGDASRTLPPIGAEPHWPLEAAVSTIANRRLPSLRHPEPSSAESAPVSNSLMLSRRFAPLFWCQFFSAFNDNFLKNALIFLILFKIGGADAAALVTLAGAVFIAPFFLLSGLGGELADRFDKALVARRLKLAEIGAAALAVAGFGLPALPVLFAALLSFGVIAALFGPIKTASCRTTSPATSSRPATPSSSLRPSSRF